MTTRQALTHRCAGVETFWCEYDNTISTKQRPQTGLRRSKATNVVE